MAAYNVAAFCNYFNDYEVNVSLSPLTVPFPISVFINSAPKVEVPLVINYFPIYLVEVFNVYFPTFWINYFPTPVITSVPT